ncbi:MAG: cyclic nucleotide-binding domain-containing protein [Nitriliruptoraceae bacterium]
MDRQLQLAQRLGAIEPFAGLEDEVIATVAAAGRVVEVAVGEHLVETGDPAGALYVVLSGRLIALAAPGDADAAALAELKPGAVVGEIAVLTGGERSATLRALDPVEAVEIDGPRFVALLEEQPELGAALARLASARLFATRLRGHLTDLFPDPETADLGSVVADAEVVDLEPGEVLFSQGDPADAAYLVVSGRVRVLQRDRDGEITQPVGEVGPGELIGERALLADAPRNATIVAARRTHLARMPRAGFERLMLAEPRAMLAVTRRLLARQQNARQAFTRSRSGRASVVLVPIASGTEVHDLAAGLAAELGRLPGSVRMLTAGDVDRGVGLVGAAQAEEGTPAELRVERFLDEIEAETDLVLLVADPTPTTWSRRCARRGDHLVLVASATDDPAPSESEAVLAGSRELPYQRRTLLLRHPIDSDRPHGTRAWLEPRDVDDHLHLRDGHAGDLGRLARYLTGRSVWLVLGGGGAKGFAHLGVVRAMEELGIPIDGVAGSSVGSAMAALVAMGTPTEQLVPLTERFFHRVLDYTPPVSGIIAGKRITEAVADAVGDRDLTDTWLPLRCMTTNLTRSTAVVHRSGDLRRALRASVSIPGVMPAVAYGDDLHVDGGVMNNLPVDVARRENPTGSVIASDVAPVLGPRAKGDHGLFVTGSGQLARRFTPGLTAPRVPRLMPTLMRSLLVAAAEQRDRGVEDGLADLHLQFELRGVGLLDFEVVGPVADRGYEESVDALRTFASLDRTVNVPGMYRSGSS